MLKIFLTFLTEEKQLFSDDEQDWYVEYSIYNYFWFIEGEITEKRQKGYWGKRGN